MNAWENVCYEAFFFFEILLRLVSMILLTTGRNSCGNNFKLDRQGGCLMAAGKDTLPKIGNAATVVSYPDLGIF